MLYLGLHAAWNPYQPTIKSGVMLTSVGITPRPCAAAADTRFWSFPDLNMDQNWLWSVGLYPKMESLLPRMSSLFSFSGPSKFGPHLLTLDHVRSSLFCWSPHLWPISRCLDHSLFACQIPIFAGYTSFWFILVGFIFAFCVSFVPSQTSIICDASAPGSGVSRLRWSCWALWSRAPGSGCTKPGSRG